MYNKFKVVFCYYKNLILAHMMNDWTIQKNPNISFIYCLYKDKVLGPKSGITRQHREKKQTKAK